MYEIKVTHYETTPEPTNSEIATGSRRVLLVHETETLDLPAITKAVYGIGKRKRARKGSAS